MSPISSKKAVRRLVLGRETLRTLTAPSASGFATIPTQTSYVGECSCQTSGADPMTVSQGI